MTGRKRTRRASGSSTYSGHRAARLRRRLRAAGERVANRCARRRCRSLECAQKRVIDERVERARRGGFAQRFHAIAGTSAMLCTARTVNDIENRVRLDAGAVPGVYQLASGRRTRFVTSGDRFGSRLHAPDGCC